MTPVSRLNYNIFMVSSSEAIIRLLLGAVIGGIIGFEREVHGRAAGFRTQLIVCMASVLIMIVSENYHFYMRELDSSLRIDPARIASGALIGIGFLGGGVIVKSGYAVRGLTTAASIWIVSAIGLSIGAGLYIEGIATSAVTIIALVILRKAEKHISTVRYKAITVSTEITEGVEERIMSLLSECGINIHSVDYKKDRTREELVYVFNVFTKNKTAVKDAFYKIGKLDVIKRVQIDSQDKSTF
ncbi:MAG: MgtC/SapB family protein [Nitrospirota bacterium]